MIFFVSSWWIINEFEKAMSKAVTQEKFQEAHKAKIQEVKSPTGKVLGAAAKNFGTQSIFLGASD